jgi:hypothetical protein
VCSFCIDNVVWKKAENNVVPHIQYKNPNNENETIVSPICSKIALDPSIRGERLKKSQMTVFDSKLGRTVNVYNNGEVYGYKTTQYISPSMV